MIRSTQSVRRSALALGLAIAATTGSLVLAPAAEAQRQQQAQPPQLNFSRGFRTAAAPVLTAWTAAKARPDVVAAAGALTSAQTALNAATTRSARTSAQTGFDAAQQALIALVQPNIDQINGLTSHIENNDDRYQVGLMLLDVGQFTLSSPIQRRALTVQLESGKVPADKVPLFNYFIGKFAFMANDYPAARAAMLAATQGGYHAGEADWYLAETYFAENDAAGGLAILRAADELARREGRAASTTALQRGLSVANDAMKPDDAGFFGSRLVEVQPSTENWRQAIAAVRRTGGFDNSVLIDLVRLMPRTNSYDGMTDYLEFIQIANNLKYPRELLAVIQQGTAAGVLNDADPAVREARADANAREALDRSTNLLPDYERDARAANANVATIVGAADSFLSYGQTTKAEEFYALALTKPGVDSATVHTRLGIAQFDQGKFAEAAAHFGQVTGPRASIAQLWAVLSRQRATPAS